MKRVIAIARLNLLELFRDRTELVSVIVLPLMLTWVFGAAFGSAGVERAVEIPVADLDDSTYSRQLVELIDGAKAFDVKHVSRAEARQLVRDGDAPASVTIAKGFGARLEQGQPAVVAVRKYPSSQNAEAVAQIVDGAAARISANASAARVVREQLASDGRAPEFAATYRVADRFWEPDPPVGVEAAVVRASQTRSEEMEAPANTQYSLGFTVFFVFMTALGSASGVLEDRELGTLRRILAAPARRAEILGGKVVGVAFVASFEAVMLVVFGAVIFGVPWGKHPAAVALLLFSLVLAATGLGVMVSALVRTRSQMSAVTPVLATALAMLGGCYWPVEITSPAMQVVAKFTPTGWAMAGLKDAVARGMGVVEVLVPVALLLIFAVVTIAVGVTRLRLE